MWRKVLLGFVTTQAFDLIPKRFRTSSWIKYLRNLAGRFQWRESAIEVPDDSDIRHGLFFLRSSLPCRSFSLAGALTLLSRCACSHGIKIEIR